MENEGVAPDHDVTMWPKDVIAGKDPQLEKAIELALEALKKNPPAKVVRAGVPQARPPAAAVTPFVVGQASGLSCYTMKAESGQAESLSYYCRAAPFTFIWIE